MKISENIKDGPKNFKNVSPENLAALDLFIVQFAHFQKLEKKFSRSLSPEISILRRS